MLSGLLIYPCPFTESSLYGIHRRVTLVEHQQFALLTFFEYTGTAGAPRYPRDFASCHFHGFPCPMLVLSGQITGGEQGARPRNVRPAFQQETVPPRLLCRSVRASATWFRKLKSRLCIFKNTRLDIVSIVPVGA